MTRITNRERLAREEEYEPIFVDESELENFKIKLHLIRKDSDNKIFLVIR